MSESTNAAGHLPQSTAPAVTLPGSTPPAVTLPVSTPPAVTLPESTTPAFISATDTQPIVSPFTLTRWYSPVASNPFYDLNMISPSPSALLGDLAVELLCDFEHGLCDWEQSTTDDFDWMLHRHQIFSRRTGPKWDHTKGQCKGQGGSLNVFLKYENSPHWHKLWSVSGNQGRKWLNAEIDIFTNGETYRVIIEGVLGLNYQSAAAIDDMQIYRSSCASGWKRRNPSCNRALKKRNKSHLG
ncbi:MAM and LDL-receptor class A domain-containing protein 1-like [Carcharodon carcharias]|uniref:MAM and LDL-receptor class A domain-containing protein 1-like n=1 Tax=Carcharodon carcharias TaxID=13397 RepID=UPI001B7DDA83|nr:MAM and LDL-receptor class A domain-containing protein 1-like [Carcharodon carcharias]